MKVVVKAAGSLKYLVSSLSVAQTKEMKAPLGRQTHTITATVTWS